MRARPALREVAARSRWRKWQMNVNCESRWASPGHNFPDCADFADIDGEKWWTPMVKRGGYDVIWAVAAANSGRRMISEGGRTVTVRSGEGEEEEAMSATSMARPE